ncbi:hypothetical protein [Helicobacter rodentium]|uniref:hypothetical protein n=1 Tax=Helicobacter rodentium TaxID=59617 RepID=UPI0023F329C3|nr:hypothetical protein [Helicobacter rodentium]
MTKNKMLCLHYCGLPRKAKAFLAMTERQNAMTKATASLRGVAEAIHNIDSCLLRFSFK